MKKTAVAFAVGALFSAPAAQAQIVFGNDTIGTMQIYGKFYPQVISASSSGATQPGDAVSTLVSTTGVLTGAAVTDPGSRYAVDTQNSYLGFRGQRKLGNTGLTGLWQIEQSLEFDTGTGVWSNRNSFLGLAGGFGTIKLGNMDTIYKEYGQAEAIFGLTSGNFISPSNVLSHIGIGNSSTGRFHERAPNSIQYQSPEWSGFQAGAQWSPDETHNDVPNGLNNELWSFGVKYERGPLYLSVQHEIHKDRFGGSNNVPVAALRNNTTAGAHSDDKAYRLTGAFKFGNHRVAADVAKLEYNESGQAAGTKFKSYEHTTMAVSFESSWGGAWRTAFMYAQGNEGSCELTVGTCSTTGLTGKMYVAGVAYDLDKQTFLYALYGQLNNGPSARYDNWAASSPARGGDTTQFAIGMQYRF